MSAYQTTHMRYSLGQFSETQGKYAYRERRPGEFKMLILDEQMDFDRGKGLKTQVLEIDLLSLPFQHSSWSNLNIWKDPTLRGPANLVAHELNKGFDLSRVCERTVLRVLLPDNFERGGRQFAEIINSKIMQEINVIRDGIFSEVVTSMSLPSSNGNGVIDPSIWGTITSSDLLADIERMHDALDTGLYNLTFDPYTTVPHTIDFPIQERSLSRSRLRNSDYALDLRSAVARFPEHTEFEVSSDYEQSRRIREGVERRRLERQEVEERQRIDDLALQIIQQDEIQSNPIYGGF